MKGSINFFLIFFKLSEPLSHFCVQYAHIIYTLTTMKYEIEKDVPMPERNVRGNLSSTTCLLSKWTRETISLSRLVSLRLIRKSR